MLAACSGGDDESTVPTLELASTTITTAAPTTTAPPTTVEPTTTTIDPRIAEVEAALLAFYGEQISVLRDPSKPLERIRDLVGSDLFATIEQNVLARRAEGRISEGDFSLGSVSIESESESGLVALACGLDATRSVGTDGAVLVEADSTGFIRSYTFAVLDSGALVLEEITFPGPEKTPCVV